MNYDNNGAAAAAIVEGRRAASNLDELHARLESCFARSEPLEQAGKYMSALIGDVPRKNGWQIAEYVGDARPDRTQRLLNDAVWDHDAAQGVVRGFAVAQFGGEQLRVAALDESGQEKSGDATAGVQRQYMGCAGRIANGVNVVYCSYATPGGHALVGSRIYVPKDQLDDPERRTGLGIGDDVEFQTKPQLAIDICRDMVADATMPPWAAGDEVYGRSGDLRTFLEQHDVGYVLRVGCAFHTELAPGVKVRADAAVKKYLTNHRCGGLHLDTPVGRLVGVCRGRSVVGLATPGEGWDTRRRGSGVVCTRHVPALAVVGYARSCAGPGR